MKVLRMIFLGDGCERLSGATFAFPGPQRSSRNEREGSTGANFDLRLTPGCLDVGRGGDLEDSRCSAVGGALLAVASGKLSILARHGRLVDKGLSLRGRFATKGGCGEREADVRA